MEFIDYSIAWCRGEIFEARIIFTVGILVLLMAVLFYKFGTTSYSKAIVIPLIVLGLIYTVTGISMNYSNQKRITVFSKAYEENKESFVLKEKKRVESFSKWYTTTRISMTIIFALGVGLYFIGGATLTSIGLVAMLLGLSGFVIDHFSQERAITYYSYIQHTLGIYHDSN